MRKLHDLRKRRSQRSEMRLSDGVPGGIVFSFYLPDVFFSLFCIVIEEYLFVSKTARERERAFCVFNLKFYFRDENLPAEQVSFIWKLIK